MMDIKNKIQVLIEANYCPVGRVEEAEFTATTGRILSKIKDVYPTAKAKDVVECLNALGFIVADVGEMEFEWLIGRKPVLYAQT
jgi:hypothetical protein